MKRFIAGVLLAIAPALLLLAPPPAAAQEVFKIGYLPQIHDAANFTVQRDLGKKYKLEYVKFLRYADAEIALSRGDLAMAPIGYATAVGAALRDREPKFVFIAGMSRGAINVVCRNDIKVAGWSDLKDKKFGVLTGGPAELFFDDAINLHGVKSNQVERVAFTAPGPPLLQALQSKAIECMAVFEPFAATAVAAGNGYYPPVDLADNSFLGINHAMAINTEFLAKNKAFAQEVVDIVVKSTATYNADRAKLLDLLKDHPDFKTDVVKVGADHIILDSNLYQARTHTLAAAMKNLGFIRELPDKARLDGYFVYDYLTKATNKSADDVGRNK